MRNTRLAALATFALLFGLVSVGLAGPNQQASCVGQLKGGLLEPGTIGPSMSAIVRSVNQAGLAPGRVIASQTARAEVCPWE
jgi:hypothetical protein